MKRWSRAGGRRKRTAVYMAILCACTGMWGVWAGRESTLSQLGQRIVTAAERKILFGAVCAVSPLVGYLLEPAYGEAGQPPVSEGAVPSQPSGGEKTQEEQVWQELEQLLLAEQSGAADSIPAETEEEALPAGAAGPFPEDSDEEEQVIEVDADLLAEIDRENQALRELAFQQAQAAQTPQPEAPAGELPAPVYSMEQLTNLDFLIHSFYNVHKSTTVDLELLNAEAMMGQDMRLQNPDSGGPKVLIHHTHATEYFADSNPDDPSTLIVGVGDYLEELLETQYGIEVIHDRTVYPYNEAYSRALKNVEQILAENPTIEVFIDLHRDAAGTNKYTVEIDGKEMANIMFFNGLSRNVNGPIDYLTNDNLAQNLAFSFQLKMAGDSLYPGLCKRNYLKSYRYNLHVLPRAVIIEVGDNNNTLEEAKNAMEPLARILAYVLNGG